MLAIRAKWILASIDQRLQLLTDRYVLVEGGKVAAVAKQPPSDADVIEPAAGLVIPGLINLHAHCLNAPLFRGMVDDLAPSDRPENVIYRLLMPVGQLAMDVLTDDELAGLVESGLTEVLASGTTTVLDMWRPEQQEAFFTVAERLGIRAYGAPYIRSRAILGINEAGEPRYGADEGERSLEAAIRIFDRYDEGPTGRLRVALGPHGTDTCSARLLRRVAEVSKDLDTPVTAHVAQSRSERDVVKERDGMSPIRLLERSGLARPRTVAAHCVYADDTELAMMAATGMTVAHCPLTFARVGVSVTADRFWRHGIPLGIGTDAYCMDLLAELRAVGYLSKRATGRSDTATAWSLLDAATRVAADALGRPDLGRIAPGSTADLAVFDLRGVHIEPVVDPIKALIWYATTANVHSVIVDGEVVYQSRGARRQRSDLSEVSRTAVQKVVREASERGLLS